MDSLDFINTHKLILNNKEIDTIETNGNTDNTTILTKSAVNNAISSAISGGTDTLKADKIKSYTANTSTITLGNNEHTILTCDETQESEKDTLSTDIIKANNYEYFDENYINNKTLEIDDVIFELNFPNYAYRPIISKTFNTNEFFKILNSNGALTNEVSNSSYYSYTNIDIIDGVETETTIFRFFQQMQIDFTGKTISNFDYNRVYTPSSDVTISTSDIPVVGVSDEQYKFLTSESYYKYKDNNVDKLKILTKNRVTFDFNYYKINKYYFANISHTGKTLNPKYTVTHINGTTNNTITGNYIYKCTSVDYTTSEFSFEELPLEEKLIITLRNYCFMYINGEWRCINVGNIKTNNMISSCNLIKNNETFNFTNTASGDYSHAEGNGTTASGYYSHAEGNATTASGYYSHAEGSSTTASGFYSHAEGSGTTASNYYSHAEGNNTYASNYSSHAEGNGTSASGSQSHAEGNGTKASGNYSHAEGYCTNNTTYCADGEASHIEGFNTKASGKYSHAGGGFSIASGNNSFAHGENVLATGSCMTAFGQYNTDDQTASNVVNRLLVVGNGGGTNDRCDAFEVYNSGEVKINSTKSGKTSKLTIGNNTNTYSNSIILGQYNNPVANTIFCIGNGSDENNKSNLLLVKTTGEMNLNGITPQLTIGNSTTHGQLSLDGTNYVSSIITGSGTTTGSGTNTNLYTGLKIDNLLDTKLNSSDAVGQKYYVSGKLKGERFNDYTNNVASGDYSHAEGSNTIASGNYSHAEGNSTRATSVFAHSEGAETIASANYSHAGGLWTRADQEYQTAIGKYNTTNNTNALLSVGNGTGDDARSDAFVVKNDGDVIIPTKLTIGSSKSIEGTTASNSSEIQDDKIIATKNFVNSKVYDVDDMYVFSTSLIVSNFQNNKLYLSITTTSSISIVGLPERVYTANKVYKCSRTGDTVNSLDEITLDSNIIINNKDNKQKYFYDGTNLLCITIGREYINENYSLRGEIFNNYTNNVASGNYSHAEGFRTKASGNYSHAEGYSENINTYSASGEASHIEGYNNKATAYSSHAEGGNTTASGNYSHSSGNYTYADKSSMFVCGKYNIYDATQPTLNDNKLFVVGNGANNARSDAFVVKDTGEVIINSTASDTTPKLTIGSNGSIVTNKIQTNTTTPKDIVSYDNSTSSTSLTYGNNTDDTIITGKTYNSTDKTVKIYNTLKVDKIKSYADATNYISKITLGNNGLTILECDETSESQKDTLTTGTIISTTIKTASSSEKVNINNTDGIITNKIKIGGSSVQEISSVLTGSETTTGSGTNNNLYTGLKIDNLLDNKVNKTSVKTVYTSSGSDTYACTYINSQLVTYAKLSETNRFTGTSNTFDNVIYTNGGISAFSSSSSTNPNHIKMKFVDNTVSSVDNDYVDFSDNNDTPLLRIYQDGKTYSPVFTTTGSDYCELFEVYDKSIPIKNYEYKFITLIDDKVKIASNEDDYILGVHSLRPGIIGNYKLDRLTGKNIQVGLLGRLVVIDNNTCSPNSYCKVDKDGCAIPYNKSDDDVPHYRVMKRIDDNKVLIMFK